MSPFLSALFAKLVPASIVGKIAVGAVAVAAVAGGGTAAVQAVSTPDTSTVSSVTPTISPSPAEVPEQSDDAGTDADSVESESSTPEAVATQTADSESTDTADSESADAPVATHPENHGGDVSAVARDTSTSGRAHGEAVSKAAHQHGDTAEAPAEEDSTGEDTSGTQTAPTEATTAATAPGNSGSHGHR